MSKKIESKIVSYKVSTEEQTKEAAAKTAGVKYYPDARERFRALKLWLAAPTRSRPQCLIMRCI